MQQQQLQLQREQAEHKQPQQRQTREVAGLQQECASSSSHTRCTHATARVVAWRQQQHTHMHSTSVPSTSICISHLPLDPHPHQPTNTQGYETLGFTRQGGKTIYREWAPGAKAAALIGDFNNWEPAWMERDEWGVWSVELPDGEPG